MKIFIFGLAAWTLGALAAMTVQAQVQEHKHEQKDSPGQKEPMAPKSASSKCCEDMEKLGGMKSDMPMKGEMTEEMKAKMAKMKAMKEKLAEQVGEQRMKLKMLEAMTEKEQASGSEHKH
jgi:hypothetical protein